MHLILNQGKGYTGGSGNGIRQRCRSGNQSAAAYFQVERIARVRKISQQSVRKIIDKYTTGKTFGFLGEERVNVLKVNLELDGYTISE